MILHDDIMVIIEYCTCWVTGICQPQLLNGISYQYHLTNYKTECDPTGEGLFDIQWWLDDNTHGFNEILHPLGHRNLWAKSMINH